MIGISCIHLQSYYRAFNGFLPRGRIRSAGIYIRNFIFCPAKPWTAIFITSSNFYWFSLFLHRREFLGQMRKILLLIFSFRAAHRKFSYCSNSSIYLWSLYPHAKPLSFHFHEKYVPFWQCFFILFLGEIFPLRFSEGKIFPFVFLRGYFICAGIYFVRIFSRLHLVVPKAKALFSYVNPCKRIPNQTKIDGKSFKNRPSGPVGLK